MVIEPERGRASISAPANMRVASRQVSERRLAKFPEVPTLKEAGFDVPGRAAGSAAVVAPAGNSKEKNVEFWQDFFFFPQADAHARPGKKYIEDNQFRGRIPERGGGLRENSMTSSPTGCARS